MVATPVSEKKRYAYLKPMTVTLFGKSLCQPLPQYPTEGGFRELTLAPSLLPLDTLFALKAGLKGCPGGRPGSGKGSEPPATPALRFVLWPVPWYLVPRPFPEGLHPIQLPGSVQSASWERGSQEEPSEGAGALAHRQWALAHQGCSVSLAFLASYMENVLGSHGCCRNLSVIFTKRPQCLRRQLCHYCDGPASISQRGEVPKAPVSRWDGEGGERKLGTHWALPPWYDLD